MGKIVLGLVMGIMFISVGAWAQTPVNLRSSTDTSKGSRAVPVRVFPSQMEGWKDWVALMKKQSQERKALNDQLSAERDQFLKDHPQLAGFMETQKKDAEMRFKKFREMMKKQMKNMGSNGMPMQNSTQTK